MPSIIIVIVVVVVLFRNHTLEPVVVSVRVQCGAAIYVHIWGMSVRKRE